MFHLPHLLNLFNHCLYYYGLVYMYFILFIIVQYYVLYFIAQIILVLIIENPFCLASVPSWVGLFVCAVHYFWVLWEDPGQSCTLPCLGHRINNFTELFVLFCFVLFCFVLFRFNCRMIFGNQALHASSFIVAKVPILLSTLNVGGRQEN